MTVRKFNRCPRCGGNMFLERESDILYEECLQCSFRRDVMRLTNVAKSQIEREKAPALGEGAKVLSQFG